MASGHPMGLPKTVAPHSLNVLAIPGSMSGVTTERFPVGTRAAAIALADIPLTILVRELTGLPSGADGSGPVDLERLRRRVVIRREIRRRRERWRREARQTFFDEIA